MSRLPNMQFHLMVPTIREEGFYEYEEPRAISWSEYNISQVEEAGDVLDFIDRELVRKIEELGMIPYVFPTKTLILNGGSAWKNMFLELFLDVMYWLTEYHQRSHCESFHSSFKRTFGIILNSRLNWSQIVTTLTIH